MGSSIYILAGNVYNWQVQHNVLHHTYTNIHEHDEDMEAGRILRFSKHAEWRKHHKFQHYYSVFLYGLLTFNWAITTDFQQMYRYMKRKLAYGKMPSATINWSTLVITKVLYLTIWIVLPMLVLDIAWWKILLGFFIMHYVAGVILSVIFQLAHIVDHADTPLPDENGTMKNTWAIHQLFTTVNFGTKNKVINWFTGGLNHQVEHHIFPNISHVHYTKIAEIVKQTAKEFNLPYNEYETTRKAIISHFKHLKELGSNQHYSTSRNTMGNSLSDRINRLVPSATLEMAAKARELRAEGKDIIGLSLGEPDFNTPDYVKDAAIQAVKDDYNSYTPVDAM